MNTVFVEYDGGINLAFEQDINKAALYDGKDVTCDSGCCMFAPFTRDLSFSYKSSAEAAQAAENLRALSVAIRVKIDLEK